MAADLQSTNALLETISNAVTLSPLRRWDFWLSTGFFGFLGLLFSVLAFWEARRARKAATEAGKTVKIQTITIELSDIQPKLDKLQPEIKFNEARDLLNEITRRLRRVVSPFEKDPALSEKIGVLRDALDKAKESLVNVRPSTSSKEEVPRAVYYAIESDFATINNAVADLLGLFEKKTINFGDEDE